ncbi:MAG: hypothetical protein WCG08_10040 [Paludibacter sp.]
MAIVKKEREELKYLLDEILSNSATFKHIEGVNPCRIDFDGVEYYVYIKNLTPAQLSNGNPDIWRIQLPLRETFEQIKESPLPFILLGYDSSNDVYTTWNPHWAKQRLNVTKNVSFYSRLNIQEKARNTDQLQRLELNNDGEVIAFPRDKISYFLVNLQIFFPDMSEYVAVGSRKRTEANEAYKKLTDSKNTPDFAHYLSHLGFLDKTISNYCHAIKNLINDSYFSRNRKLFLAHDSVAEYPSVIQAFMEIPEVKEIDLAWNKTYSAALHKYIDFLMEICNVNSEETTILSKNNSEENVESNEAFEYFCNVDNLEYFKEYLGGKELSERSVNTYTNAISKLINKGYIHHYRDAFLIYSRIKDYFVAIEGFISIPEINQLNQNWKYVFSAALNHYVRFLIEWQDNNLKSNINPTEQVAIEFPTESMTVVELIQAESETDELSEDIDWEAMFLDDENKLTRIANPLLIDQLRPYLDTEYKSTACAFNIIEDFYANRFPSMQMKDWQKLFEKIDWSNPYYSFSIAAEPEGKRKSHILRVTYPDGTIIQERIVAKTLVEVVRTSDPEKISALNIYLAGVNLVTKVLSEKYEKCQVPIQDGYYVMTLSDTARKYQILETISNALKLNLTVDFISIDDSDQPQAQPKPYPIPLQLKAKIRVTFPDGRIIQEGRVSQTLVDVVKYAGAENVRSLEIPINKDNLVTNKVAPAYENSVKPVGNGLFVHTNSSTQTKFAQIQQISDDLNLGLTVELV